MKSLLIPLLSLTCLSLQALEVPPGGQDVGDVLEASWQNTVAESKSLGTGLAVTILEPNPGKIHGAKFSAVCNAELLNSECVFAVIKARIAGSTNVGVVLTTLQLDQSPYTVLAPSVKLELNQEWREFPVTFVTTKAAGPGKTAVALHWNQTGLTVEVESIRLLKYPEGTDVSKFPNIPKLSSRSKPETIEPGKR